MGCASTKEVIEEVQKPAPKEAYECKSLIEWQDCYYSDARDWIKEKGDEDAVAHFEKNKEHFIEFLNKVSITQEDFYKITCKANFKNNMYVERKYDNCTGWCLTISKEGVVMDFFREYQHRDITKGELRCIKGKGFTVDFGSGIKDLDPPPPVPYKEPTEPKLPLVEILCAK